MPKFSAGNGYYVGLADSPCKAKVVGHHKGKWPWCRRSLPEHGNDFSVSPVFAFSTRIADLEAGMPVATACLVAIEPKIDMQTLVTYNLIKQSMC
jgi:hypothetical protein